MTRTDIETALGPLVSFADLLKSTAPGGSRNELDPANIADVRKENRQWEK